MAWGKSIRITYRYWYSYKLLENNFSRKITNKKKDNQEKKGLISGQQYHKGHAGHRDCWGRGGAPTVPGPPLWLGQDLGDGLQRVQMPHDARGTAQSGPRVLHEWRQVRGLREGEMLV